MTTFLATADQSSGLDNTQLFALADTDELLVGREATLSVTGNLSEVVDAGADTRMIINGELLSAFVAIRADANTVLQVGEEGSINASGTAVSLDGAGHSVTNDGEIQGFVNALTFVDGDSDLINTGLIGGARAIQAFGNDMNIVNHGTIRGDGEVDGNGITLGGGGHVIENTGTITGVNDPAIAFFGGAGFGNTVFNSGTIITGGGSTISNGGRDAIEFADANDEVVNIGLIAGEIDFGAGDDRLDTRQGTVTGEVFGDDGRDTMLGSAADDKFGGGDDNDVLRGFAGDDELSGGAGSDTLVGGVGDDVYTIDLATDQIFETAAAAGGVDTVRSSVSFVLAAGLESLQLIGSAAVNGVGNAGANSITGNFQANVLNGSLGNDTLTGGGGADSFTFTTALSAANVDTIEDFNVVQDTIRIDNAVFAGLPAGPLAAGAFAVGAAATQADDRIVYNNVTGALIFDANGSGAGGAVQFATLDPNLAMTANDILVV